MTFVDELEAVVKEVSDKVARDIDNIVSTLAPDGRGYEQELKSTDEKLEEYRVIRNDVESWKVWISNKALEITQQLQLGGVTEDKIAAINPLRIAIVYMNHYSAQMERELEKRMI